jgi:hypothetical protein
MKTNRRNTLPLFCIAAVILTTFSSTLYAKADTSAAISAQQGRHDIVVALIDQERERARIQTSIEEIVENGCGPVGSLEAFLQAQFERGERAYPPVRMQVMAVAEKLQETDDRTFILVGKEVLRYRDDFRSGSILVSDFEASLQGILDQM